MTTTLTSHVREYVARVREELADLPADDVDDLVCGLTADLTEALLDSPVAPPAEREDTMDLEAVFGPPAAYAAELREAAGFGTAGSARGPRAVTRLRRRWRSARERLRANPTVVSMRDFLAAVRPAWWVLRGLVIGVAALGLAFDTNRQVWERPAGWVVLAIAVIASVQWGRYRGHHAGTSRGRRIGGLVNTVGVIAIMVSLTVLSNAQRFDQGEYLRHHQVAAGPREGVWVDGHQVSNLFVYDADGTPVPVAQIFDNQGRPVQTVDQGSVDEHEKQGVAWFGGNRYYRAALTDGGRRWNVYPLKIVSSDKINIPAGDPSTSVTDQSVPWPFTKAPAIIPEPTPSPSPSPGPTAAAQAP